MPFFVPAHRAKFIQAVKMSRCQGKVTLFQVTLQKPVMDFSFHLLWDANLSPLCRGSGVFRPVTYEEVSQDNWTESPLVRAIKVALPLLLVTLVWKLHWWCLPPSCHTGAWRQGQKRCKGTGQTLWDSSPDFGYVRESNTFIIQDTAQDSVHCS